MAEDAASGGRHEFRNPPTLAPAVGFSHIAVPAPGRIVFLGGQTAHDASGELPSEGLVDQFDRVCGNLAAALAEAGAAPTDLVWLQVFTTQPGVYRSSLRELGDLWQRYFGRHYPAMSWFAVSELFDPAAVVELVGIAVVPSPQEATA